MSIFYKTGLLLILCSYNIIYCRVYYLFIVYSGDESKVPNMQDVVRKLLNALHHAITSHVVRYFLNVTHCSESWNKQMLHADVHLSYFPFMYFYTVTNDFDSCQQSCNCFSSRKLALPLTPFSQFKDTCILLSKINGYQFTQKDIYSQKHFALC